MQTHLISQFFSGLQGSLYSKLNNFSNSNKILGRLCSIPASIPLSILDVTLDTLKAPLSAIESVAMAAINLIGAAFSNKFTLKDALAHTEMTLEHVVNTPVKLVMAPIKIVFQFFAIIIDPERVQPINYIYSTFKIQYNDPRYSCF